MLTLKVEKISEKTEIFLLFSLGYYAGNIYLSIHICSTPAREADKTDIKMALSYNRDKDAKALVVTCQEEKVDLYEQIKKYAEKNSFELKEASFEEIEPKIREFFNK